MSQRTHLFAMYTDKWIEHCNGVFGCVHCGYAYKSIKKNPLHHSINCDAHQDNEYYHRFVAPYTLMAQPMTLQDLKKQIFEQGVAIKIRLGKEITQRIPDTIIPSMQCYKEYTRAQKTPWAKLYNYDPDLEEFPRLVRTASSCYVHHAMKPHYPSMHEALTPFRLHMNPKELGHFGEKPTLD